MSKAEALNKMLKDLGFKTVYILHSDGWEEVKIGGFNEDYLPRFTFKKGEAVEFISREAIIEYTNKLTPVQYNSNDVPF